MSCNPPPLFILREGEEKSYIPILTEDILLWRRKHIRRFAWRSFFSLEKRKPDTRDYHKGYEGSSIENVYTNSKLEAEKLVIKAGTEKGIPTSVYRVGNLSCNSKNGVFQRNIDNNAF